MSRLGQLSRGETNIDFVGLRKRWFTISATLIVVSLLALAVRGLNLGLEFQGGTLVQAQNEAGLEIQDVRDALAPLGLTPPDYSAIASEMAATASSLFHS